MRRRLARDPSHWLARGLFTRTQSDWVQNSQLPMFVATSEAPSAAPRTPLEVGIAMAPMALYSQFIDPAFDAEDFMTGAAAAKLAVADAYSKGDLDGLRPMMAPKVLVAHERTLDMHGDDVRYAIEEIEAHKITKTSLRPRDVDVSSSSGSTGSLLPRWAGTISIDVFFSVTERWVAPGIEELTAPGIIRGYRFEKGFGPGVDEDHRNWIIADIL